MSRRPLWESSNLAKASEVVPNMLRTTPPHLSRRAALSTLGVVLSFPAVSLAQLAKSNVPGLQYPLAAAVDAEGAIYVIDLFLPGVFKVVQGKATVFYRAEKKYREPLFHPRAIAVIEKDALIVADTAARDLFLLKAGESPKGLTGKRLDVPAAIAEIDGTLFVADTERNEIWKGTITEKWAKWVDIPAPRGLAVNSEKQLLVVSGRDNVLYKLAPQGGKPGKIAQGEPTGYWSSVAVGKDGIPVVVDSYAKTLWRIEAGKPVAWVKGEPFDHPVGIVRMGDGFLVTDSRAKALIEVSVDGKARVLPVQSE